MHFFIHTGETDGRCMEELEELIWDPELKLSDRQIDQFLVIARYTLTVKLIYVIPFPLMSGIRFTAYLR